jgi:peptidoglycan/LPS O-acetylase OafA/YrhL
MHFSKRLESIRGLAALMVAASHSFGGIKLLSTEDKSINDIFYSFGNGALAVTIFFVLSGHVLSLSLNSKLINPMANWPTFMARRLLRIYPAMLICLFFCFIYIKYFHHLEIFSAASNGYYEIWQKGSPITELIKNVFFLDNYINPVTWTLQVEMLGAIGLPLLLTIKIKFPRLFFILLLCWISYFVFQPLYIFFRTGFLFMFLLGMYAQDLSTFLAKNFLNKSLYFMSLVCVILAINVHFLFKDTVPWGWVLMSLFSMLLISCTLAITLEYYHFPLDLGIANFLGKISYSFYLWHMPVLYIFGTAMFKHIDNDLLLGYPLIFQSLLFFITCGLTIPLAIFSYNWIEAPFKTVTRKHV